VPRLDEPQPTRLGITIPLDLPLAEHPPVLTALQRAGYTDFWTAETARCDAFTPLAHAAAVTTGAHFGTAIASVYARGPAALAMSAAAVAEAAPGRFLVGIGASSPTLATDWNAAPYDRPLSRVRDTARFLRAVLRGARIDAAYDTFAVRGFRLERPPADVPPVLVAALRPGMLRVAAQEADGAVLNWLAAADVPAVRAHLNEDSIVAARIFVCPSTEPAVVRNAARRLIATYTSVPAYARFHAWLGRGPALAHCWQAWAAGDRRAAAAAVPDDVVDALIVHGPFAECAARVREYVAAGVDVPVLKFLPLDPARELIGDALAVGSALADARV
jgi:probable F420-dependent oxidoreductase